ncbi:unnamed protein product [Eruca vesicaria subsp. sativa]|uniref:RING-type E3 ubiquitin transferase n=1 Tax=Eruca vesicaria subsp. sativa TaxID=29727 RepID=A0ABC8KC78_ERUVS|nr:unnamed protein product [Eruca vesicaria subsp. sativa]
MVSETPSRVTNRSADGSNGDIFISPRFKSAAALAGWDEEDLIIASFVVEDTPERSSSKRRRRSNLLSKTSPPSSGSRRRQRIKQSSSNPLPVIDLDKVIRREEERSAEKKNKKNKETKTETKEEKSAEKDEKMLPEQKNSASVVLPCIDKLRDELSCAICLEICFEPSTTTCGHSFCKKCLRSAADKCGRKCPKCRQLIGNGKYCTVNTVLWNTIQLLFPKEVEAQRAAASSNFLTKETPSPRDSNQRLRSRNRETALQARLQREDISRLLVSEERSERRRRGTSVRLDQDSDAAFALRLQRQELASAFGGTGSAAIASSSSSTAVSLSRARANLRAMASRAARRQ